MGGYSVLIQRHVFERFRTNPAQGGANTRSICAFSGLEDGPLDPGTTQNWGQGVKGVGGPFKACARFGLLLRRWVTVYRASLRFGVRRGYDTSEGTPSDGRMR